MGWIIYSEETGEIRCDKVRKPAFLPDGYATVFCPTDVCVINNRVEHGKIAPKGIQQRQQEWLADGWRAFREERLKRLMKTDHLMISDIPMPEAQREALLAKRQASRDIPQTYQDPEQAMQALDDLWSDD